MALHYLRLHFEEYVPSRRIDRAKRYAREDPDLKNLMEEPEFLEMVH